MTDSLHDLFSHAARITECNRTVCHTRKNGGQPVCICAVKHRQVKILLAFFMLIQCKISDGQRSFRLIKIIFQLQCAQSGRKHLIPFTRGKICLCKIVPCKSVFAVVIERGFDAFDRFFCVALLSVKQSQIGPRRRVTGIYADRSFICGNRLVGHVLIRIRQSNKELHHALLFARCTFLVKRLQTRNGRGIFVLVVILDRTEQCVFLLFALGSGKSASDMLAICRFIPTQRRTSTGSAEHTNQRKNQTNDNKAAFNKIRPIKDPTVGRPLPYEQSDRPNEQESEQHRANDHRGSVCFPHRNLHSAVFKRLFSYFINPFSLKFCFRPF